MSGYLMTDIEGLTLTPEDRAVIASPYVVGIILFSRNYANPAQLKALTDELHALKAGLMIVVDQEGGRIQRFKEGFSSLPSMGSIGELYEKSPEEGLKCAHYTGKQMASELKACGVDASFAPVLDVRSNDNPLIGDRSFSASVETIKACAQALIAGMNSEGMVAIGKHYPGHGGTLSDSHISEAIDPRDWNEVFLSDLHIYDYLVSKALLEGIMVAHVQFPAIKESLATYSDFWLKTILREQLAYQKIIFSDCLSMQAAVVAGSVEQRIRKSWQAGCDVALLCNQRESLKEVLELLHQEPFAIPKDTALRWALFMKAAQGERAFCE